MNNILTVDLDWEGKDVYVVGSGPNAAPYMMATEDHSLFRHVPNESIIIACNAGIYIGNISTVWLCATPALAQCDWFNHKMRCYTREAFKKNNTLIVGREGEWLKNYDAFTHFFRPGASLWSHVKRDPATNKLIGVYKGFGCIDGYLRGGASAVARGVQLAWFKKAKRCILIGADMKGIGYFDGTINEYKPRSLDNERNWIELDYFNALIQWIKERDMDVVSLTETMLDVEIINA